MRLRPAPLFAGVALLAIYIRIGTAFGYHAVYGPALAYDPTARHGFVYLGRTELRFWLAHLALALPGALLIAYGLAPRFAPALRRLVARIDALTPRRWRWAALAMFVALAACYALGHRLVLCDRPITDDENGVTFGARMIAEGHLRVPVLQPAGAFPELFTFQREGMVSSLDFAGAVLFAAAGIATGLGSLLYAIASAASGVAVAYAAKRWLGARGAVLAAALWIASPMIAALSITTHAHVPSRMFVALALACAARLDTAAGTPRRDAVLFGLCAGLAVLCRPLEAAFLLAPLGAWLVWRSPRRALGIAAGLAAPLAIFAWYNVQLTGVWYLQARFASGVVGGTPSLRYGMADRLGFNLGFNLGMLAVFFLGVPAFAVVLGGLDRKRPILVVLGACVLGPLALCLLHDNTGVHSVGPIHLSETTVPLVILATAGVLRGFAWLGARGRPQLPAGILVAGYLALGCGIFGLQNCASLHDSAERQTVPDELLAFLNIHHAIVIADQYAHWAISDRNRTGTWVLEYPHPDPFFRDDILFAKPTADRAALRAHFPDRKLYTMTYSSREPTIMVLPADPGS